jgi:hypothetical protein
MKSIGLMKNDLAIFGYQDLCSWEGFLFNGKGHYGIYLGVDEQ